MPRRWWWLFADLYSSKVWVHDRFGVMTLAWALIGYATLFDLGLGRALTQLIAQRPGTGEEDEVPLPLWTSLLLLLALGLFATAGIFILAPWLVQRLHVPAALAHETLYSLYLPAISLPAVISTAGPRRTEAYQRFDLIFALRIPWASSRTPRPWRFLPFSKESCAGDGRSGAWPFVGVGRSPYMLCHSHSRAAHAPRVPSQSGRPAAALWRVDDRHQYRWTAHGDHGSLHHRLAALRQRSRFLCHAL